MQEAEKIKNKNYVAIGKFLRAYHFFTISLKVGSIPYTEAVKENQVSHNPNMIARM